jgi:hypothetical protein
VLDAEKCYNCCNAFKIRRNARGRPVFFWCGHDLKGAGDKLCLWTTESLEQEYRRLTQIRKPKKLPKLDSSKGS